MPAVGEEHIGRVLGRRYRLVAPVGTGASAVVFVADDVVLKRRVAVKVLHPSLAEDPMFLKRFRAEAQAAAALNHPNIMAVHDWGEEGGTPFLVTEFLSGGSLRSMLDRNRLLSPSQALLVGLDAARGLDYAHRRGFVHRDIKPANLLFDGDGRLRIADFGLARALAEAAWTEPAGVVLGTARYASPEQAKGLAVDGTSDVYSLALVLVESVTGSVPFAADTTVATLMNRIDKLLPVSADLGPLAAVVERAGRPEPSERYTAAELGRALIQTAERLPRPAPLALVPVAVLAGPGDTQLPPSRSSTPPAAPEAAAAAAPTARARTAPAGTDVAAGTGVAAGAAAGPVASATLAELTEPARAKGGANGANGHNGADHGGAASVATAGRAAPPETASGGPPSRLPAEPPVLYDEQPRAPKRRRRVWLGVAAAVVLVAAIVGGVIAYQRASTPTYPVPPLVGVEIAKARNIVSQYDWQVEERTGRNDTHAKGVVFQQEPVTGTLKRGAPIMLYVSEGPFPAKLPDLVGKDQAAAQQLITSAGLTPGSVTPQFDETVPAGIVMSWTAGGQAFPPGTEVTKGTTVDLVISGGPQPRTVPKLIGQPPDAAIAALQQLGLVPNRVDDQFSDTVPAGAVMFVDPPAGTKLERGRMVNIVVSKGPDVVAVPNVIGMDLQAAVAALTQGGLVQGTITGPIELKVRATDPGPTLVVKRGTPVNITMG